MTKEAKKVSGRHTAGPYSFRFYATDDDPAKLRALGIEPVRMLTNEGQVAIMAPDPDQGTKRIALVDCQTKYKRGTGYKTDCAERDANARLFAEALNLMQAVDMLITHGWVKEGPIVEHLKERVRALRAALMSDD